MDPPVVNASKCEPICFARRPDETAMELRAVRMLHASTPSTSLRGHIDLVALLNF
jgi:hypothetical protein